MLLGPGERLGVLAWLRQTTGPREFKYVLLSSFPLAVGIDPAHQLLVSLSNNSLESYTIPAPPVATASTSGGKSARQLKAASTTGQIEPVRTHVLERQGHRADVRCLSVSSDDQVLASAANGESVCGRVRVRG